MLAALLSLESEFQLRYGEVIKTAGMGWSLESGRRAHRQLFVVFPSEGKSEPMIPRCCLFPCEGEAGYGSGPAEQEGSWQGKSGVTHK